MQNFNFVSNQVYGFSNTTNGYGIFFSGTQIGATGKFCVSAKIKDNKFYDVWRPIHMSVGSYGMDQLHISGNECSVVVTAVVGIVITVPTTGIADGLIADNIITNYTNPTLIDPTTLGTIRNLQPSNRVAVAYSASITPNVSTGDAFEITANNGTAFSINSPVVFYPGQRIWIDIRNNSGGALGVITWNAIYHMSAWTNPANGFCRTICFEYNGTYWKQYYMSTVDIPL